MHRGSEVAQLGGEGFERGGPACGEHEVSTPIRQMAGDPGTDASGCPGDDDDTALKISRLRGIWHLDSVVSSAW